MVGEQSPGEAAYSGTLQQQGKPLRKRFPVAVVEENVTTLDFSYDHMLQHFREYRFWRCGGMRG
jgi:hypothetical protein